MIVCRPLRATHLMRILQDVVPNSMLSPESHTPSPPSPPGPESSPPAARCAPDASTHTISTRQQTHNTKHRIHNTITTRTQRPPLVSINETDNYIQHRPPPPPSPPPHPTRTPPGLPTPPNPLSTHLCDLVGAINVHGLAPKAQHPECSRPLILIVIRLPPPLPLHGRRRLPPPPPRQRRSGAHTK